MKILVLTLLISFLALSWSSQIKSQPILLGNTPQELSILADSPISIDGNAQLAAAASSGNGSSGNPYIIKNKIINTSGSNGITIFNTNAYFILRNCTVTNTGKAYTGILLYNVTHARLENITANNNGLGIELKLSNYNILNGTIANNNFYCGISLWRCNSSTLIATTTNHCPYGLDVDHSNSTNLIGITANDNWQIGLYVIKSHNNTITGATTNNNSYGIDLYFSYNITLTASTANDNTYDGIYLAASHDSRIIGNTANNNAIGIDIQSSNYNTIKGNTLHGNAECIVEESSTGNIQENNDCGVTPIPGLSWTFTILGFFAFILLKKAIKRKEYF